MHILAKFYFKWFSGFKKTILKYFSCRVVATLVFFISTSTSIYETSSYELYYSITIQSAQQFLRRSFFLIVANHRPWQSTISTNNSINSVKNHLINIPAKCANWSNYFKEENWNVKRLQMTDNGIRQAKKRASYWYGLHVYTCIYTHIWIYYHI